MINTTGQGNRIQNVIPRLLVAIFRGTTWATYGRKYRSPIRPDRLLWIDPHRIRNRLVEKPRTFPLPPTHVLSGDWDRNLASVKSDVVFSSFYEHFVENEPWTETEYVDYLQRSVSEHGNRSKEAALERCRNIDQLYDYIEANGYLCQEELERRRELLVGPENPLLPAAYREIAVNITRDGEFVWHAGMHRLVITQILDIQTIPVRVHIRHGQWQNKRESVYTTGEHGEYGNHPDVEYLR